jgi:Uma2 family endonuclease
MSPMKSPHAIAVSNLTRLLSVTLGARWSVRVQLPLEVGGDSVPEPDLAVIQLDAERRALPAHPATAPLVFEVSDSTLAFDREDKLPLYARAAVPEYVIANVKKHELEVYRRPAKAAEVYGQREAIADTGVFRSRAIRRLSLRVKDVFAGCR